MKGTINLTVPLLPAEMAEFGEYATSQGRSKGQQGRIVLVDRLEAWKRARKRRGQPRATGAAKAGGDA